MSEGVSDASLPSQTERLGAVENVVREAFALTKAKRMIERVWTKDATLWKDDAAARKSIPGWLGWLRATDASREQLGAIREFADEVRQNFSHVLLIGMGGSSLCPEVLRRTFGRQTDFPELLVLDSTDPDTLARFERQIDLRKTLFVIASKSGTTIEPLSLYRYFFNRVEESLQQESPDNNIGDVGSRFVAITDPGTWMEEEARAKNFRQVLLNPPDIGGRYSALSLFGTVPAALMGLDADALLTRAETAVKSCKQDSDENQAARLGTIIGACALAGRDKLTLVIDEKIASLGLWIEQLVAESTGKETVGVLPISSERLGAPEVYGDDRLFVSIGIGQTDGATQSKLDDLCDAGHPVITRNLADELSLAAEFFVWEFATAIAGAHLEINPFDQPNVQASKDLTKRLLEHADEFERVSEQTPLAVEGELAFYVAQKSDERDLAAHLKDYLATAQANDFIALLAYLEETDDTDQLLDALVARLRTRFRVAVTAGYGPRYLHSTGQLHKGGANNGVFLIITKTNATDRDVPDASYTFGKLFNAQSLGDFAALAGEDRRVARLHLGQDTEAGLRSLLAML